GSLRITPQRSDELREGSIRGIGRLWHEHNRHQDGQQNGQREGCPSGAHSGNARALPSQWAA
ncbi:hypothetical protein, partial [Klebsiella pneumoniae]|uniref:hypothetical protein n=1 Tax=Klebsiella pneumoniae TaxID=573 RepID=UPI001952F3CE